MVKGECVCGVGKVTAEPWVRTSQTSQIAGYPIPSVSFPLPSHIKAIRTKNAPNGKQYWMAVKHCWGKAYYSFDFSHWERSSAKAWASANKQRVAAI
jgi:hypothetical protein